jgi:hypothetical protein
MDNHPTHSPTVGTGEPSANAKRKGKGRAEVGDNGHWSEYNDAMLVEEDDSGGLPHSDSFALDKEDVYISDKYDSKESKVEVEAGNKFLCHPVNPMC